MTDSTLKLAALIVPLGLDTFGGAIALGIAGVRQRKRLRIALLFAAFEAAMPLLGVALGAPLGHAIGSAADYGAALLILALGVYLLIADDGDDGDRLLSLTSGGVLGAFALGVSVSLDELAIGLQRWPAATARPPASPRGGRSSLPADAGGPTYRRASRSEIPRRDREPSRGRARRTQRPAVHRASELTGFVGLPLERLDISTVVRMRWCPMIVATCFAWTCPAQRSCARLASIAKSQKTWPTAPRHSAIPRA